MICLICHGATYPPHTNFAGATNPDLSHALADGGHMKVQMNLKEKAFAIGTVNPGLQGAWERRELHIGVCQPDLLRHALLAHWPEGRKPLLIRGPGRTNGAALDRRVVANKTAVAQGHLELPMF